ncbi:hypothetical protein LXL04_020253 [Taraxacum kok-saghyz]
MFKNKRKKNMFAKRIFSLFDLKYKGVLDFGDLLCSTLKLHLKTKSVVKLMLIAFLRESELRLADETLEMILDNVNADANRDGTIDKSEWRAYPICLPYPFFLCSLIVLGLMYFEYRLVASCIWAFKF